MKRQQIHEQRPHISRRRKPFQSTGRKSADAPAAGLSHRQWQMLFSIAAYGGMLPGYLLAMLHYTPQLRYSLNLWVKNMPLVQLWLQALAPADLEAKVKYIRFLKHLNGLWEREVLKKSTDLKLWAWWESLEQTQPEAWEVMNTHRQQLQDLEQTPAVDFRVLQDKLKEFDRQQTQDVEANLRRHITQHLLTTVTQQQQMLTQYRELEALVAQGWAGASALAAARQQLRSLAANQWLTVAIANNLNPPASFADRPQYPSDFMSSWVAQQLNQLVDAELVEVFRPSGAKGYASACFYLSRNGRRQVAKHQQRLVRDVPWKPVGSYVYTDLNHRIAQSQFRVAFTLAAQRMDYKLEWLDTLDLEKLLKGVTVELSRMARASAERATVIVPKLLCIPDDFVWVDTQQGWVQPFVIELDNNSETISSSHAENTVAMKYRTWSAFCQQGLLRHYFRHCEQGTWHVTVTTGSEERLHNLQAAAMDVVGKHNPAKDRYWFCRLNVVKPSYQSFWESTIFTAPIWLRGDGGEYQVMDILTQQQRW